MATSSKTQSWKKLTVDLWGDFDEIPFSYEKKGMGDRSVLQMQQFRDALEEATLKDVGFRGQEVT